MINIFKLLAGRIFAGGLFVSEYIMFYMFVVGNNFNHYVGFFGSPFAKVLCATFAFASMVATVFLFLPVYNKKTELFRNYTCVTLLLATSAVLQGVLWGLLIMEGNSNAIHPTDGKFEFLASICIFISLLVVAILLLLSLVAKHKGNLVEKSEYSEYFAESDRGFKMALPKLYYELHPPKSDMSPMKRGLEFVSYLIAAMMSCFQIMALVFSFITEGGFQYLRAEELFIPLAYNLVVVAVSIFYLIKRPENITLIVALLFLVGLINIPSFPFVGAFSVIPIVFAYVCCISILYTTGMNHPKDVLTSTED